MAKRKRGDRMKGQRRLIKVVDEDQKFEAGEVFHKDIKPVNPPTPKRRPLVLRCGPCLRNETTNTNVMGVATEASTGINKDDFLCLFHMTPDAKPIPKWLKEKMG